MRFRAVSCVRPFWYDFGYCLECVLRIDHTRDDDIDTLVLEGQLAGPWVGELRRVADRVLACSVRLQLNLLGVSYADAAGTAVLRELIERGAVVVERSTLIEALLK